MNKLNSEFTNIFKVKGNKRLVCQQYKLKFETPEWNQVTYGAKNVKVHGPQSFS